MFVTRCFYDLFLLALKPLTFSTPSGGPDRQRLRTGLRIEFRIELRPGRPADIEATPPPRPRKAPKQDRSRQTVRAIREACGIILQREGAAALTTQRIAEVAGVNIASLYQYFPNKDAVLADYFDREADRIARRTAQLFEVVDRLSQRSLEHTLAAIVELELEQRRVLMRLNPDFFSRYPGGVDVHARVEALTRSQQNPGWEAWLPDFLARHRSRLRRNDTGLLASICHGALRGVVNPGAGLPPDAAGSDAARAELLFLLLGYLLARPPSMDDCERYFGEIGAMIEGPAGPGFTGDADC